MKSTLERPQPKVALHLKMNLKKQQLQEEHFTQIEHENQLLMKKIYHIMNDKVGENAMEYLPGVRLTKNQRPAVDCTINMKKRTAVPGKAVIQRSLNFEAWERKYNKHVEENTAMMRRLKERKPVYSRDEWKSFAADQAKYSKNARSRDLTAGHLPKSRRGSKKHLNFGIPKHPLTPSGYQNEMIRQRSPHSSHSKQHEHKRQQAKSVIVEADTNVDGMDCALIISELNTSFHDSKDILTHACSGILVEVSTEGGTVTGQTTVSLASIQNLVKKVGKTKGLENFVNLKPFPERIDLYPTFEVALTAEEEVNLAEIAMANIYVSQLYEHGSWKLKVTCGQQHTKQIN